MEDPNKVRGFTGIRDVDREILLRVSDNETVKVCVLNSYFKSLCDEDFYWRRFKRSFPKLFEQKKEGTAWKDIYLQYLYYIGKLNEEYNFKYDNNSHISPDFVYKDIVNLLHKSLTSATKYFLSLKYIFDTVKDIYNKYGEFMYVEYVVGILKTRNTEFFAINKTFWDIYKFYVGNKYKSTYILK